jgi:capsular exopolysaccharide synthesis family protein
MTTLPQTTAVRLPRSNGQGQQLAPAASPAAGLALYGAGHGAPGAGGAAAAMTAGDVWRVIRGHMWLILFMLVLAAVAGYGVNYYLGLKYPRYRATGLLLVSPSVSTELIHPEKKEGIDSAILAVEQKTQAAALQSDSLLNKVLTNDSTELRKTAWFKRFPANQAGLATAKEDFSDCYSAEPIPETRLVRVSFTYGEPKDCAVIVREMCDQHIKNEQDRILNEGHEESQQLANLKSRYKGAAAELEMKLNNLRGQVSSTGGAVLNRINTKESQLEMLRRERSTIDINFKQADSTYKQIEASLAQGIDPPLVDQQVDSSGQLAQYKSFAEQGEENYRTTVAQLGPDHPRVKILKDQADRLRQRATDYEAEVRIKARNFILDQYKNTRDNLRVSLDQIDSQIEEVITQLGEVTDKMVRYYAYETDLKATNDALKEVQGRLDILQMQQEQKLNGKVKWYSLPEIPTNRSFPQLKWSMTIAVAIGLVLALTIAFVREMTDTTVRSDRDITRMGQMALLGMVGDETQDPQAAGARLPLVIFDAPHSMTAEQLRQVRTRLQHAASLDTTRSILVTSPSPGDGKTTIACNLAAGLALNGRRILLVDGNFRRPEVHKVFGLGNDRGFSDVLGGSIAFDEVVQETQVPNLSVMSAGPKPINATEMFESQLLIDFIERALEEFDHVIFDSGPMMVVSESQAMAPRVDGVVTVVRARSNSRGLLQRMRDTLRQIKAEHLGVVLNGVRAQGGGYYGRNIKAYYEYQNG